jgi:hypothetical protein
VAQPSQFAVGFAIKDDRSEGHTPPSERPEAYFEALSESTFQALG